MKPLILNFITERKEELLSIDYSYNHDSALNVVNVDKVLIPLIDVDSNIINIRTETKTFQESSDATFDLIEERTITEVKRESVENPHNFLLELKTKTFTIRERDDESIINLQ